MCIIGPSLENILKVFVGDFEHSWVSGCCGLTEVRCDGKGLSP